MSNLEILFFCCFTTYLTAATMFSRRKSQHILREIPNLLLQLSIFPLPRPLPSRTSWNFPLKSPSPAVPHGQLTPRLSPVAPPSLGHGGGFRGFRWQRGGVLGLRGWGAWGHWRWGAHVVPGEVARLGAWGAELGFCRKWRMGGTCNLKHGGKKWKTEISGLNLRLQGRFTTETWGFPVVWGGRGRVMMCDEGWWRW